MQFFTPLAFALAALLPILVALYFLKLRRTEQRVSSTYLWRMLVRDTAANAPWQKLKPNWLLLLQLLFLAALIVALARPFVWGDTVAGSHLILVMDTSASMHATDVSPDRLGEAVARARRLVENLPMDARVTVIDAGATVRVPVSAAADRAAALSALEALRAGLGETDMASALTLAATIAENEADAQTVILSDGHWKLPAPVAIPAGAQFLVIGSGHDNQALGAFTLTVENGGHSLGAFLQLVNYADQSVTRRLVLRNELGRMVAARDVEFLPNKALSLTIPDLPVATEWVSAQLEGSDYLGLDDRAWAVAPARAKAVVRVVTTGNRFLETALGLMPNVTVTMLKPQEVLTGTIQGGGRTALTILDSTIPTTTLPAGNLFFIAPPRGTEFFSVTGSIAAPQPVAVSADDSITRYVDLNSVAVQDASRIELPKWGRAVLADRVTGAPLLVVGETAGRHIGILAFDLRHSDLPLRVAFPLLMANLLDVLIPGGASGIPANVALNHTVGIPVSPGTPAVSVRAPDGSEMSLTPAQGRVSLTASQTGVYEIVSRDKDNRAELVARFAVNALNANESDIAPRADWQAANGGAPVNVNLPRTRNEWWTPLAWLALALLIVEWLYAYRGQVARAAVKLGRRGKSRA